MIRLFFLLPIIMCAIWWWYLDSKGYTAKQGFKGYMYILAFNSVLIGFFAMMIWLTN